MMCPKRVKLWSGTVSNPVTQVTDVAVKKRSNKGMGTVLDMGRAKISVPRMMVARREKMTTRPGEKRANVFIAIGNAILSSKHDTTEHDITYSL
jgi:hypothetical protein